MAMGYDHRGNRTRTWRHIGDDARMPLLVGDGWQDAAYAELLRLRLTTSALHEQLVEGDNSHQELGKASKALKAALKAFQEECGGEDQRAQRME